MPGTVKTVKFVYYYYNHCIGSLESLIIMTIFDHPKANCGKLDEANCGKLDGIPSVFMGTTYYDNVSGPGGTGPSMLTQVVTTYCNTSGPGGPLVT